MYSFDRKARYYEWRHQCPAQRKIAVSPMVPQAARAVTDKLGIEVFGHAEDVTST
ncbi:MAG TPA: hypothetical protein P5032_00425 [Candidatus Competibacter sp.]|jgi:hypothetical protein|nr:hypothetical protein [Candidatus Competibacteraceae bacterium]HRW64210.1 hypothetical protein [Candidatus Competibacter sp.]